MDLSGKIDNTLLGVLRDVSQAAALLGIPFFVIGATARDIVLEHGFGIKPGRATRDLDLGVRVADWQEFQALTNALLASKEFTASSAAQRLFHRVSNLPVDIVPFGEIASGGAILWPPQQEVEMNLLGFEEAYAHAWVVRLSNDLEIPFVSPAVWALLKIISWHDRDLSFRVKDAQDLAMILLNYAGAGNVDRLYGEKSALLQEEGYALESAGARLLGRDIAEIGQPETVRKIMEILEKETRAQSKYRLVAEMTANRFAKEDLFEEHLHLLMKLKQGISEVI